MKKVARYPKNYLLGLELYREGKFWESHEAWEVLWRDSEGSERHFYQGLIQLDAALLHTRKRHWAGVLNLLNRAIEHLQECPNFILGINLNQLLKELRLYLKEVEQLKKGKKMEFDWSLQPRLELRKSGTPPGMSPRGGKIMNEMTKIIQTSEIQEGQGKCVEVGGKKIAIFNVGGTYYATDDTCTHAGGPLSDGDLDGKEVTCPWHGASFDVTTGKVIGGPARADIKSYKVTVQGNEIKIEAP